MVNENKGEIVVFRTKTKNNHCDSCLNKRGESKRLFKISITNFGCTFKLSLCDSCINDISKLATEAKESKGEPYSRKWEGVGRDEH